jgi:GAF domain-containing protein
VLDLNAILSLVVNLISEQFGFYHAGLFLLDDSGEFAVLQAASSEGGKKMLARSHRLLIGQQGIVGAAAYHNRPRIALDVGADREYFNNPDLPLTRSEVAIPLTVHNKVIGVLDIQSIEEGKFVASDIDTLQILADQVALAIQNARLLAESQDAIQRLEAVTAENMRRAWHGDIRRGRNSYRYTAAGLTTPSQGERKVSLIDDPANYLNIPIQLRGQQIGTISLHRKGSSPWSESDRSLVNEISTQIGLALENARLVQDTQLRAEREQTLSQMTAKIRETLDMDVVLKTAVREIKQSFNLEKAEVRLLLADPQKQDSQTRQP